MKKTLMMLGLLSTLANATESTMKIFAEVIQPLSVRTTAIDFGRIVTGEKAIATSSIGISGKSGSLLDIEIPTETYLKRIGGNETLKVNLNHNIPRMIGIEEKSLSNIIGSIDVPRNQKEGTYEGTIIIKIQYK